MATAKDIAYLNLLQEAQKNKKLALAKSEHELLNEERERGFQVHFAGANKTKDLPIQKNIKSTVTGKVSFGPRIRQRRGWNNQVNNSISGMHDNMIIRNEEEDGNGYDDEDFEHYEDGEEDENYDDSLDKDDIVDENLQRIHVEQEATNEDTTTTPTAATTTQSRNKAPVNELLQEKLAALDTAQQAKLLALIEKVVATSPTKKNSQNSIEIGRSTAASTDPHHAITSSSSQQHALSVITESNHPHNNNSSSTSGFLSPGPGRGGSEASFTSPKATRSTTAISEMPTLHIPTNIYSEEHHSQRTEQLTDISIRIRLGSSWGKEGHVSLDGLRLHASGAGENRVSVDLQPFKIEVLNGLVPLTFPSPAILQLPRLIGTPATGTTPRGSAGGTWKAPFNKSTNYIEIKLSGCVSPLLVHSLELTIVNTRDSSMRVKDADVYLESTCVWSGRWSENTTDNTLVVPLWPSTASKKKPSPRNNKADSPSAVRVSQSLLLPQTSALVHENVDSASNLGLPSWLDNLKRSPIVEAPTQQQLQESSSSQQAMELLASPSRKKSSRRSTRVASGSASHMIAEDTATASPGRRVPSPALQPAAEMERSQRGESRGSRRQARESANAARPVEAKSEVDTLIKQEIVVGANHHNSAGSGVDENMVSASYHTLGSGLDTVGHEGSVVEAVEVRVRRRNSKIADIQEVLAKMSDSLAVLVPAPAQPPHRRSASSSSSRGSSVRSRGSLNRGTTDDGPIEPIPDDRHAANALIPDPFYAESDGSVSSVEASKPGGVPSGKVLLLRIKSNWGDDAYLGLNGIDIYNTQGTRVDVLKVSITKPTQNKLDKHAQSKVLNLVDGFNFTKDSAHTWLLPLDNSLRRRDGTDDQEGEGEGEGEDTLCELTFEFKQTESLSLLVVWNYNESRTRRMMGCRACQFLLDRRVIFEGEIEISSGLLRTPSQNNTSIVLVTEEDLQGDKRLSRFIQERIAVPDEEEDDDADDELMTSTLSLPRPSPSRGEEVRLSVSVEQSPYREAVRHTQPGVAVKAQAAVVHDVRESYQKLPATTTATVSISAPITAVPVEKISSAIQLQQPQQLSAGGVSGECVRGRTVTLVIETTWEDVEFCGLTGLQVLCGPGLTAAELSGRDIKATPHGLADIGYEDDVRTPDKLVSGVNNTTNEEHMWLFPFTPGGTHECTVQLKTVASIAGLRLWNFNKSPELAKTRGVKYITLFIDQTLLFSAILRPGPGYDGVDFHQDILLKDYLSSNKATQASQASSQLRYISPLVRQDYETPLHPTGLLWTFTFQTNYGDPYYIGLDCLEMFDIKGKRIDVLSKATVASLPPSITELGLSDADDDRTCKNLFLDYDSSVWLAPLARNMTEDERRLSVRRVHEKGTRAPEESYSLPKLNTLFVMFDMPVTVSYFRLRNYSKTPARGVRDFSVYVDGSVVYMGTLPMVVSSTSTSSYEGNTVLFTNDAATHRAEKARVAYCGGGDQDVLCINEKQVMVRSKAMYDKPQPTAEGVHTDISLRPQTMMTNGKKRG